MEKRKNFYNDELNMERVEEAISYLAENLNLKEIFKVIREISYDMVSYYDDDCCGYIYKSNKHSEKNRWQACKIQRCLSAMCDLFIQSVIDSREFDDNYLSQWIDGGYLQNKVSQLEEEIERLKESYE